MPFPDLTIGSFQPVAPIMWQLGTHKKKSESVTSMNHNLYIYIKQLSTYKWCSLCNQGFDQFVNVFRNWWPVERSKGNLIKIIYVSSNAKEKKGSYEKY